LQFEQLELRTMLASDAIADPLPAAVASHAPLEAITQENFPEVWKTTFGSFVDLRADANRNGFVDAADYTVWKDGRFDPHPPLTAGPPPQVLDVIISGTRSTHVPYSFATVAGSGEQLRTVPVGGADTITIRFSEPVNYTGNTLRLVGLQTAIPPVLIAAHFDLGTNSATWTFDSFSQDLPPGQGFYFGEYYQLILSDAITDIEGNALDGEWVNPASIETTNPLVSHFPSGDGVPGGSFRFIFTILPGDANRDMRFDELDLLAVLGNQHAGIAWPTFSQGDFDGDGLVTSGELSWTAVNWGVNLGVVRALGDLNGDNLVNSNDVRILDDNKWVYKLPNPTPRDGDLDRNGIIDIRDLDILFAQSGLRLNIVL
jgi:hypothetical protein